MSDDRGKQTPITDVLLEMAGATKITFENGFRHQIGPELMKEAADRLQAFEVAARAVRDAVSAGGITSADAPSDAALAALRDLVG